MYVYVGVQNMYIYIYIIIVMYILLPSSSSSYSTFWVDSIILGAALSSNPLIYIKEHFWLSFSILFVVF